MRFLNSIIIAFTLTVASSARAAMLHSTPLVARPSQEHVQNREPVVERDFYCPTKEQRGSFCSGGEAHTCTPLMRAAESGRVEKVRALLASRVDVNARLGAGHTALMFAAMRVMSKLLKRYSPPALTPMRSGVLFITALLRHGWPR